MLIFMANKIFENGWTIAVLIFAKNTMIALYIFYAIPSILIPFKSLKFIMFQCCKFVIIPFLSCRINGDLIANGINNCARNVDEML